ncbi:membrane progestin receptor gamma-B isoform X2 [Hydra vulgaris]|uniref:Membrane progestin receptor gamma-B isoform X2 n=1 Tax=Hydra vulgaris TaxID=6087 RepID=A0ABM4CJR0_HYDVU
MSNIFCLNRDDVPSTFHDPYIEQGYRRPNLSVLDCLKSATAFKCNESFNIISHFLATIYFVNIFISTFSGDVNILDRHTWPLVCHAFGNIAFTFMSTIAHTFNSMSVKIRHRCFYLDYASISIYAVGAGQTFFYYTQPSNTRSFFFTSSIFFNIGCVSIAILATLLNCISRFKWNSMKYTIRTLTYVVAFFWNVTPYFCRLQTCVNEADCNYNSLWLFVAHAIFFILAAIANITKLPEKVFRGTFDHFGQSHNLMHIFVTIGCVLQFEFAKQEMKRSIKMDYKTLDYKQSVYYMAVSSIVCISIALFVSAEDVPVKKRQ